MLENFDQNQSVPVLCLMLSILTLLSFVAIEASPPFLTLLANCEAWCFLSWLLTLLRTSFGSIVEEVDEVEHILSLHLALPDCPLITWALTCSLLLSLRKGRNVLLSWLKSSRAANLSSPPSPSVSCDELSPVSLTSGVILQKACVCELSPSALFSLVDKAASSQGCDGVSSSLESSSLWYSPSSTSTSTSSSGPPSRPISCAAWNKINNVD